MASFPGALPPAIISIPCGDQACSRLGQNESPPSFLIKCDFAGAHQRRSLGAKILAPPSPKVNCGMLHIMVTTVVAPALLLARRARVRTGVFRSWRVVEAAPQQRFRRR